MKMKQADDIFEAWFGKQKPRWKQEFEERVWEIEKKTGVSKKDLMKVAEALEQLRIIRL